jgi:hypothetical protein
MEFYYFGGHTRDFFTRRLHLNGFDGVMFTYDSGQGDLFTLIARDMRKDEKFKYLVAIRPHTISAQYLCMIKDSLNAISPNRIQVNLISGKMKEHEKKYGGILGDVNDLSNHIDRSNYLIKYVEELNQMGGNSGLFRQPKLDYYVSTTNQYTLDLAHRYNHKIILSYRDYKNKAWTLFDSKKSQILDKNQMPMLGQAIDLKNIKVMLSISPVIRDTQEELDALDKTKQPYDTEYFTYEEFNHFVKNVNADQLLLGANSNENIIKIFQFVKNYKELNTTKP